MPNCRKRSVSRQATVCVVIAVICCGCNREPDANRFIPASDLARAAVEAVLVDWQAGLPRGQIDRLKVKVEPIDNQRKKGQTLAGFEILGEVTQPGVRCFAVRLEFQNATETSKVRYVVLGIDPLFVYRQEDFELLNHWDHMMPGRTGGCGTKARAAGRCRTKCECGESRRAGNRPPVPSWLADDRGWRGAWRAPIQRVMSERPNHF